MNLFDVVRKYKLRERIQKFAKTYTQETMTTANVPVLVPGKTKIKRKGKKDKVTKTGFLVTTA